MGYPTEYKPEGYGHPWQRVQDDHAALRVFISHVTSEFETRPAWVVTETGNGPRFTAFSDETYDYLMVFTGDALAPERRRRGIAIEPMTCAPNAFRSGDGLVVLDPGASMTSAWGITTTGF